jgi:hypothetical protein
MPDFEKLVKYSHFFSKDAVNLLMFRNSEYVFRNNDPFDRVCFTVLSKMILKSNK